MLRFRISITEKATSFYVRRMHDGLKAKPHQRIAEFQGMHHAATRIG